MKICRLCKYPIVDEKNGCEKCNASFREDAVSKNYSNERGKKNTKSSKKTFFLNVAAMFILFAVAIGSYVYINQGVSTYNKAAELWNDGEIQDAMDVASEVSEKSRKYEAAQLLINDGKDYFLYSKALELWNDGDIIEALEVAKGISESSDQYEEARKLIKEGEDYLLYSKAAYLWNTSNYEEALKILQSFTEESKYYMRAQDILNGL